MTTRSSPLTGAGETTDGWEHTHTLRLTHEDGTVEEVEVYLTDDSVAYTHDEWIAEVPADWEVDGGEWLFQGQSAPPGVVSVEVRGIRA